MGEKMANLIVDDDKKKARDNDRLEKDRQKKQQKERKQREREQKNRHDREIKNSCAAFGRVVDRMKSIEDMNLRCYMLLDKVLLASDAGLTMMMMDEADDETLDEIMSNIGKFQIEVKNIMDWLMSDKKIPIETTNPIPESEMLGERRCANFDLDLHVRRVWCDFSHFGIGVAHAVITGVRIRSEPIRFHSTDGFQ